MTMNSYHGVRVVTLTALVATLTMTAANVTYGCYLLGNESERYLFLDLVGYPIIWIAQLNKVDLPLAAEILRDTSVDEWSRYMKLVGAFLGIGFGTLAGLLALLVTTGKALESKKHAFNWKVVGFLRWALLVVFAAYGLIGIGYLYHFRVFLGHPALSSALSTTIGYFLLSLLQFYLLSFLGYYAYRASQDWWEHRNRKTWQ